MVGNIVGRLVEVGCGARSSQSFADLLEACDRAKAGPMVPPHGLLLVDVRYQALGIILPKPSSSVRRPPAAGLPSRARFFPAPRRWWDGLRVDFS